MSGVSCYIFHHSSSQKFTPSWLYIFNVLLPGVCKLNFKNMKVGKVLVNPCYLHFLNCQSVTFLFHFVTYFNFEKKNNLIIL